MACLIGLPWFYSYLVQTWIIEEFAEAASRHPKLSDASLKLKMIDELEKRASYFYYRGLKSEFPSFLKQRYQVERMKFDWGEFKPERNLHWKETETGPVLLGTLCHEKFKLDLEIPWTANWLADTLSSVLHYGLEKPLATRTFILEGEAPFLSMRDLEHLRDHATYLQNFQILELEPMAYSGTRWVDYPIAMHRIVAVNKNWVRNLFWSRALWLGGWFFLLGLLIFSIYGLYQSTFSIIYRVLGFQALTWIFLLLCLNQESEYYLKEQALSQEYQREVELLSSKNHRKLELSYEILRDLLPLSEEGVYSIEKDSELIVFRAFQEGFWGDTFPIKIVDKNLEIAWFLVFLSLSVGLSLWFAKPFSECLKFEGERVKAWLQGHSPPVSPPNISWVFPEIREKMDELEQVLEMKKSRLDSFSHPLHEFFQGCPDLNPKTESFKISGLGLYLGPIKPESFEMASCRDYFELLNQWLAKVRSISVRHQAVVFMDRNWVQGLLFCRQPHSVLRQRAMVCGLELIQALEGLTESPFFAVIQEGELEFSLMQVCGREEFFQEGTLAQGLEAQFLALTELSAEPGLYIPKEEAFLGPGFFDFEEPPYKELVRVRGLKDLSQHLSLLRSGDPVLEKAVLDLLSLGTQVEIVEEVFSVFPDLSAEAQTRALELLEANLGDSALRQKLLSWLPGWTKDHPLDRLRRVLEIYERMEGGLSEQEVETLLTLDCRELEDSILRLVLRYASMDLGDRLMQSASGVDSPAIQALLTLEEFRGQGLSESLDKVLSILEAANPRDKIRILNDFKDLDSPVKLTHKRREELNSWSSVQARRLQVFFRDCLRDKSSDLVLVALQNIAFLRLRDFTKELIHEFQKSPVPEIRSQCIKTLNDLGADRFLMTALI
jgi:hypothetical protein